MCIYYVREQCICQEETQEDRSGYGPWTPDTRSPPSTRPVEGRPTTTTCSSASAEPGPAATGSGGEAAPLTVGTTSDQPEVTNDEENQGISPAEGTASAGDEARPVMTQPEETAQVGASYAPVRGSGGPGRRGRRARQDQRAQLLGWEREDLQTILESGQDPSNASPGDSVAPPGTSAGGSE